MEITCPECSAHYTLKDGSIGPQGRTVRCTKCKSTWKAMPETVETSEPENIKQDLSAPQTQHHDIDNSDDWGMDDDTIDSDWGNDQDGHDSELYQSQQDDSEDIEESQGALTEAAFDKTHYENPVEAALAAARAAVARPAAHETILQDDKTTRDVDEDDVQAAFEAMRAEQQNKNIIEGQFSSLRHIMPHHRRAARHAALGRKGMSSHNRKTSRILTFKTLVATLCLAMLPASLVLRNDLARLLPDLASLFAFAGFQTNTRGITFSDISVQHTVLDGIPALTVKGQVRNITPETQSLPAIRPALAAQNGRELYIWSVEPDIAELQQQAIVHFTSTIPTPHRDAVKLNARFMERPQ